MEWPEIRGGNLEDLSALHQRPLCRSGRRQVDRQHGSLPRRGVGQDPAGLRGRCRSRREGSGRGVQGSVVEDDAVGARQADAEARRPRRRQRRPAGRDRGQGQRQAACRDARPGRLSSGVVALLRRPRRQDRGRGRADRQARHLRLHAPRADGRGGGADRLELAAAVHRLEVRAGDRRGLHRGGEAVGVRLGLDARVRGAHQGGGLPRRRVQRRHRLRPGSGRGAGRSSRRRQDHLHRLGLDRRADLRAGRQDPEARLARAGRQVAQHRVRGLRPRRRRGRRDLRHLRRHRPDLHRGLAAAGAELDPRGLHPEGRRARPHRAQGRSDEGRHQHRPCDDHAAVPQDPRLHGDRQGRGRALS